MIVIVDYGMGNLHSVEKAFRRIGADVAVTGNHQTIISADKLVLPGVGNFESGMQKLVNSGLRELLDDLVLVKKKPILGICLGMQLFTSYSEEGNVAGLNWIEGQTLHLGKIEHHGRALPVPHMGWNDVEIHSDNPLFQNIAPGTTFYFVHSFAVQCTDSSLAVASSTYGKVFHSIIGRDNIIGTQFHPEKSHKAGLQMIENFVNLF